MNGDSIRRIVAEIAYRRARQYHRMHTLPRLIAVYVYQRSDTRSLHGPVIEQVRLIVGAREVPAPLGLKGLALIDVLVRYKPNLLSAAQIEHIMRTDPACARLGIQRLMNRRIIKVYIHRLRLQLVRVLADADIVIEPKGLIVSASTELANVKAYRLATPCTVVHRSLDAGGK